MPQTPATLLLEDHSVFHGTSFGANTDSSGEVVFNTGMVGYPESLTDPSYKGQILTITYPLVGNYGVPNRKEQDKHHIPLFFESNNIKIQGLVVSEYSENFSHWNAKSSLGDWLKEEKIPAITGIDTRALTQKLRQKGAMLGKILIGQHASSSEAKKLLENLYDPNQENIVDPVSVTAPIIYKAGHKTIIAVDCGMKNNIIREFLKRNITVIRVPWNYDFFKHKEKFHGIFISNGPGDPAAVTETHQLVKTAMEKKIPTFGICLGSQIMGIAAGAKTYKLKFGHRGQNQPVIDLDNDRCYITSQNHGFAVDEHTLPKDWHVWMKNANDDSIEGIKHKKLPFFSVQFHPEATPGPQDSNFLFDKFAKIL